MSSDLRRLAFLLPGLVATLLARPVAAQDAAQAFDPERLTRVGALLRTEVESGRQAGASFLILHRGRVAAQGAFGVRDASTGAPLQRDTIVRIYSMSKMLTAVSALQLFEAGKLQLDDPIARFLPELGEPMVFTGGTLDAPVLVAAERPITVRMLLNHTAGYTYGFFGDTPIHRLYQRADLWNAPSLDAFLERVAELPLLTQPGETFSYGISDDVLGAIVERVSGQPFADYVREHVTAPLGMVDTDFDVPEEKRARLAAVHEAGDGGLHVIDPPIGAYAEAGRGFAAGGAGLFSTLDDYARFAECLRRGGELDGVRILGRKTLELACLDSLPEGVSVVPGIGWGLLCSVCVDVAAAGELGSVGMLSWSGAATTHFFVDPREELVAVLFCQEWPFDRDALIPRFRTAVYQALR